MVSSVGGAPKQSAGGFNIRILSIIDLALTKIDSDDHFTRYYKSSEEEVSRKVNVEVEPEKQPSRRMSYLAAIQSTNSSDCWSSRQGGRFEPSAPRLPLHLRQSNQGQECHGSKVPRIQEVSREDDTRVSTGGSRDQGKGGKGKKRR